jgi:hypothetical protein
MKPEPTDWSDVEELPGYDFYDKTVKIHFDPSAHVYFRFDDEGNRLDINGVTTVLGVINKSHMLVPWATKLCIETLKGYLFDDDGGLKEFSTEQLLMWMHEAKNKHRERLEEAGDIGHIAHDAIERAIKYALEHTDGVVVVTEDTYLPDNEQARNCVLAAFDWMAKHNVRWLATERKIYSREFDVAGTADGKCIVDSCDDIMCCRGRSFKDRKAIADWKSSNHLSDSYAYQTAIYQFAEIEEFGEYIPDRWILRLGKEDGKFEPWYIPNEFFEADLNAFLAALQLYRSLKGIEERRKSDKAHLREIVRGIKRAAKELQLAEEREERRFVREASKAETKARKEAADAHYKQLRADGMPVAEAKAIAYPRVEKKPKADPEPQKPVAIEDDIDLDRWVIQA